MKILSKLQGLVDKKSSKDKQASAEKPEIDKTTREKPKSHYFILQALETLERLKLEGGTFICSSPDFECYFKKQYMTLFEGKKTYINVAFDNANNVTHVCGLLARLQNEKDREKIADEGLTLSKMPDCLLSHAIKELSRAPQYNRSRASNIADPGPTASTQQRTSKSSSAVNLGQIEFNQRQISKAKNFVNQGQAASTRQQRSNIVFDQNISLDSLKAVEKEWLNSMQASLIDSEYEVLLHLLQHSIVAYGFQQKIEHFLKTRKELEPGSSSIVVSSFEYLAREFQFDGQTISVAKIGTSLQQRFHLKCREIFSIIVELFFCLGYEKKIKGYTTGFIESS